MSAVIEYKTGDIFQEEVEALVNSVNCVGIMGRGIALQFKKAYPDNFRAYEEACKRREVQPGRMFVYETGSLTLPRFIVNFPTKRHWRGKSRMEDISSGLMALAQEIRQRGIKSIAVPALGTSLGGLQWDRVRASIEEVLGEVPDLKLIVYEPGSVPADNRPNPSTDVPRMSASRATVIALMHGYLVGLLDPFLTLLEIHKLLYFMQSSGERLRLQYKRDQYGPYAANLRFLLRDMEGHMITGYGDGGDAPFKEIDLVPGAVEETTEFLEGYPETQHRLRRVFSLIEGFESAFGLELLSTVHWTATEEPMPTDDDDVIARTYAWGPRKRQFSERQIRLALNVLREQGWLRAS